jgi:hypothetical protein
MASREQLRDRLLAELTSYADSWLDGAIDQYGEDFSLGTMAIVFEVEFPPSVPDGIAGTDVGWTCSDHRNWAQAGLFRRAMLLAEGTGD